MAVDFIGIVFLGTSLGVILFLYPFCSAFMAGIQAARDPSHRVTPESSWVVFDQILRRRLWSWKVFWIGSYVAWVILLAFFITRGPNLGVFELFMLGSSFIFPPPLGPLFYCASFSILWAPRFKSVWTLLAASMAAGVSGFLVFLAFVLFAFALIAETLPIGESVFLFILPGVPLVGVGHFVRQWRRVRRLGERWFRFED